LVAPPAMAILFTNYNNENKKYRLISGNRYDMIAMQNKWSVSGTELAENWVSGER